MLQRTCCGLGSGLLLGLVLMSFPAIGDEPYRLELHGGPSIVDSDFRSLSASMLGSSQSIADTSSKGLEFGAEYFFRPIEADSGPLWEAAFLERASSLKLSLGASRADSESAATWSLGGPTTETTSRTRFERREYELRYRFVATEKPWFGIASYGVADNAAERLGVPAIEWDDEHIRYSVGVGRYLGSRTAVTAEYGRSRLESSPVVGLSPGLGSPGLGSSLLSRRDRTLSLGVHSVLELRARGHLGLTAAQHEMTFTDPASSDDSLGSYVIGVSYYPRNNIAIGLSAMGYHDGDPSLRGSLHEYMLEANWFVTPSIAVGLAYETTDYRLGFVDSLGFSSGNKDSSSGFRFNFTWRR